MNVCVRDELARSSPRIEEGASKRFPGEGDPRKTSQLLERQSRTYGKGKFPKTQTLRAEEKGKRPLRFERGDVSDGRETRLVWKDHFPKYGGRCRGARGNSQ